MRIAAAFDPRSWGPAHAAMHAVSARLAMVERCQVKSWDAVAAVCSAMAVDQARSCHYLEEPNDLVVMRHWAQERGPAWQRAMLAVSGAAQALVIHRYLPPDGLFAFLAPLEGTPAMAR